MDDLRNQIKKILEEINPYIEIQDDTKLLDEGVLDSLEIFAFVTQLEDAYDIEVPDEAITKEHFESIDSVVSFVRELMGEKRRL